MADKVRKIVACSCDDSMALDGEALRRACRGAEIQTARQLCRAETERFRAIAADGGAVTVTCTQAQSLDRIPLRIHTTISTSRKPIVFVKKAASCSPSIRPTISWCLGTMLSSLQKSPLTSHTEAIKIVVMRYGAVLFFILLQRLSKKQNNSNNKTITRD